MFLSHNGKTKYPSQDTKIPASLALTPLVVQQRQAPVAGAARTTLKHTATIARNNMVSSPGSSPNSSICVTHLVELQFSYFLSLSWFSIV